MSNRFKINIDRIYRTLLFVFSCVVIIYFFPKSGKFKYNFENGRPWQSDNLYAPFDFAIKKTNKELINVFVPTTPNPTSGFLLMFPIEDVIYLNMTFEEASKFMVSAGTSTKNS